MIPNIIIKFSNANFKQIFSTILFLLVLILFYQYSFVRYANEDFGSFKRKFVHSERYSSQCECMKNENITIAKTNESFFEVYSTLKKSWYSVTENEINHITCDIFQQLRRGKNQKVLGFALFGKDERYYKHLSEIAYEIKKLYPGWLMRVYHDNSISSTVKCDMECLKDANGVPLDNLDFCNVEYMIGNQNPLFQHQNWFNNSKKITWNASYINAYMWRWFPIGDLFVDVFNSRDSDSKILQREVDSVNVWLKSDKVGHIMRDHQDHGALILAGMWGFHSKLDRNMANSIFKDMIDLKISQNYIPYRGQNNKEKDQYFLASYVYNKIKQKSVIHDSYLCWLYNDSEPFPTRRIGNCFVGGENAISCINGTVKDCPIQCRPKNHQDWNTC